MNKVIASAVFLGLLAALLAQPHATAQDKIYKWVDAEGVVHYTARPPEDMDFEEVGVEVDGSGESEAGETTSTDSDDESADESTSEEGSDDATLTTVDAEQLAEDCRQAQSNLENLSERSNIVMHGEDGEQRRIGEDKRQELIDQAQQFIDKWCQDRPAADG